MWVSKKNKAVHHTAAILAARSAGVVQVMEVPAELTKGRAAQLRRWLERRSRLEPLDLHGAGGATLDNKLAAYTLRELVLW